MAETIGSLVDKISIAHLKIYHMQEQADRPDIAEDQRERCRQRVVILTQQENDLSEELSGLVRLWSEGKWIPKVYRQFKMYNDPQVSKGPLNPPVRPLTVCCAFAFRSDSCLPPGICGRSGKRRRRIWRCVPASC